MAILLASAVALPAHAQTRPPRGDAVGLVEVSGKPLFPGAWRKGWHTFRVSVRNLTPDTILGRLEVYLEHGQSPEASSVEVTVGPGATVAWNLPVYLSEWEWRVQPTYGFRLVDGKEVLVEDRSYENNDTRHQILVPGGDRALLSTLQTWQQTLASTSGHSASTGVSVYSLPASEMPEHLEEYDPIDLVVIREFPFHHLQERQRQVLRDWVYAGGTVLFLAGTDPGYFESDEVREYLPGNTLVGGADAGTWGAPDGARPPSGIRGPGIRWVDPAGSPMSSSDSPVARIDYGFGEVFFCGMDITQPAYRSSDRNPVLLGRILRILTPRMESTPTIFRACQDRSWDRYSSHDYDYGRHRRSPGSAMVGVLTDDLARMPSFFWIALLVCAYVVIVSPVNFFVLRRLRRHHLLGLTIPAVALFFTFLVLALGYVGRGVRHQARSLRILETTSGDDRVLETQYLALLSSAPMEWDLSLGRAGGVPIPMSPGNEVMAGRHRMGRTPRLEGFPVRLWEVRLARSLGVLPAARGPALRQDGAQYVLRNDLEKPLAGGLFRHIGGSWFAVPPLAPGEEVRMPQGHEPIDLTKLHRGGTRDRWEEFCEDLSWTPDGFLADALCLVATQKVAGVFWVAVVEPEGGDIDSNVSFDLEPLELWVVYPEP